MHNKPFKTPLCSSTKSGKLVDKIGKGFNVLKSNIYDVDYYPKTKDEKFELAKDWQDRVKLMYCDVIVLLGAEVHDNFLLPKISVKVLKIAHPSSMWSHKQMDDYVKSTREKIIHIKKGDKNG